MADSREKIRVLIAEDHRLMREGTREFLRRHEDIEVVGEAADGQEAIRLARELQPDVVLMDIKMQPVNGIEATRSIKASSPRTSVLVLTMYEDDEYVLAALKAGAAGYLLKDVSSEELVRAVRDVYAGEAILHPIVARKVFARLVQPEADRTADSKTLSDRELEVLRLAGQGFSNKEIASRLALSPRTVQAHLSHVFDKLRVGSRTEAIVYALRQGYLRLEEVP